MKPHRMQKNSRLDEALRIVVKATEQVAAQHLASLWLPDLLAQKFQWQALFVLTMEAASTIAAEEH